MINFLKKFKFQITTSIFFPLACYAPFLWGNERIRFFSLDVIGLYAAQYAHQYHRFREMIFSGVDFFTANGSSQYFLRPNIVTEYPFHFLSYLLPIHTPREFLLVVLLLFFFHCVMAVFFGQLLGIKFFRFSAPVALFFSLLYAFSTGAIVAWQFTPFYYCVMWVPVLTYTALSTLSPSRTWRDLFFASFIYVSVFLCGYAPLALFSVTLVLMFAVFYEFNSEPSLKSVRPAVLVQLFSPVILAAGVVIPYYLAILGYHNISSSMPRTLFTRVFQISLKLEDFFSTLSFGILTRQTIEIFSLYIGLISLLPMVFFAFSKETFNERPSVQKSLLKFGLPVYALTLLMSFGTGVRLTDIFYYFVPFLGGMHIYPRFLLIAYFFLALAISAVFSWVSEKKEMGMAKIALGGSGVLFFWLVYVFYYQLPAPSVIALVPSNIFAEILVTGIFLGVYLKLDSRWIAWTGLILVFLMNITHFYRNTDGNEVSVNTSKYVFFNKQEEGALHDFMRANAPGKVLIKYENVGSREPHGYITPNYPWYCEDKIKLSNYYGNELHLASNLGFRYKFPWYGVIDREWLKRTGCDYLIATGNGKEEFKDLINDKVSFPLSNGGIVYKTNFNDVETVFDNGILKLYDAPSTQAVRYFKTDYATRVEAVIESTVPVRLYYALYPEASLRLFIDGQRTPFDREGGQLKISLPAGEHQVEFRYHNRLLSLFNFMYGSYFFALLMLTAYSLWGRWRKKDGILGVPLQSDPPPRLNTGPI